jgi:hypothetical protein
MKKILRLVVAMVFGLSLVATTGFSATYSGFLGDQYGKLQPGPRGGVDKRWLKPGTDFGKYKKVMADGVIFFFAQDSKFKGVDPQAMKAAADDFNLELIDTLKDSYPVVTAPGPDVIRIRIAITGVKQNQTESRSTFTSTLTNQVYTGTMSIELMAADSTTNEVIALAVDTQKAGPIRNTARDAFKYWAGRIQKFLETSSTK